MKQRRGVSQAERHALEVGRLVLSAGGPDGVMPAHVFLRGWSEVNRENCDECGRLLGDQAAQLCCEPTRGGSGVTVRLLCLDCGDEELLRSGAVH